MYFYELKNRLEIVLARQILELWPIYNQIKWTKMVELYT